MTTKVGTITNATNNDEESTIIKVIGNKPIKLPIIPGQNISGKNAANVVAVDAIIGQATSPTACLVASKVLYPLSINLYIFSTTTIALSTNMPNASTKPNKVIILIV